MKGVQFSDLMWFVAKRLAARDSAAINRFPLLTNEKTLWKISLVTLAQRPEIEGRREGPHALVERFQPKGRLQRTIWCSATVLLTTLHLRPAHTNSLFNARTVPVAGIGCMEH